MKNNIDLTSKKPGYVNKVVRLSFEDMGWFMKQGRGFDKKNLTLMFAYGGCREDACSSSSCC